MIQPSQDSPRVAAKTLQRFVLEAAQRVGIPEPDASTLAELLITSDLRGVFSHGSIQMLRYAREIRSGGIKAQPTLSIHNETPNSLIVDGDYGLGYFPMLEGTRRAIVKAQQHGMAALVTRHHGHIGAAGIYARMTLEHDLLTFVTSGHQLFLKPGRPVIDAAGGSPMAFSAPAMHEPPLVLDCGVTHDIQGNAPPLADLIKAAPGAVLRAVGFGTVCQSWGGLLTGLAGDPARASTQFKAAHQGAMLFTFKISLFADVDQFKREMDEYAKRTRTLTPIAGSSGAYLPGGVEADREKDYRRDGIPLGEHHRKTLETLADELSLSTPW